MINFKANEKVIKNNFKFNILKNDNKPIISEARQL